MIADPTEIPAFSETDLLAQRLLPAGWTEQILSAIERSSSPAVLRGGTSTSLEPTGSDIEYRLLDGLTICDQLPWLDDLYRCELAQIASEVCGARMVPSDSIQSGVNLNVLDGPGGRYELHYDSNPLTGVLFVTGHTDQTGGQLLFRLAAGDLLLNPRPGTFITFDARQLPHAVTPLTGPGMRISAPMNYYLAGRITRSEDLDHYLYGPGATKTK